MTIRIEWQHRHGRSFELLFEEVTITEDTPQAKQAAIDRFYDKHKAAVTQLRKEEITSTNL